MKRFILQKSEKLVKGWVCTDTKNGIVCVFEDKKFNDTQEFTLLEDAEKDANKLAQYAREMGDWLIANHYGKVF